MSLFIDLHCHPTLKNYLFGHSVYSHPISRKDINYTGIQVTVESMSRGEVKAAFVAHYLPEKPILRDWELLEAISPFLRIFAHKLFEKIEGDDAFAETIHMIDRFEADVSRQSDAVIAHNYTEFKEGLQSGKTVFVHTLEGAHHLGRGLTADQYIDHVKAFKAKGIAMITLAHFYPNDIAYPVEGIPPQAKILLGMHFKPMESVALTPMANLVINEILDQGMIVDLSHTNPETRRNIFELNSARGNNKRPLIFSHTGCRALFSDSRHPEFGLMTLTDEEILAIKSCNGVIGVIFMNYWLSGREERLLSGEDYGFGFILQTIKHIAHICGSFDNIAIGTDFDGMSNPPDDFYDPSSLKDFRLKLLENKDYLQATDEDIDKITGNNILRVLEEGWN